MPTSLTEVFFDLLGHAGRVGIEHLSRRLAERGAGSKPEPIPSTLTARAIGSMPRLPSFREVAGDYSLPSLPSMPAMPSMSMEEATKAAAETSAGPGASYAAEMDDVSVACVPCTRGHLSTMHEAARTAASSDDPAVWREQIAVIAGEGLVMEQYDWTREKMARARPEDRQAIEAIQPEVHRFLSELPTAPRRLVLAWAATGESLRFARSPRPTDRDHREIELRMRDAEAWLNYAERVEIPASGAKDAHKVLPMVREARHRIVTEGYTPEALAFAEERLRRAVVAMTPTPDRDTVHRVAATCRQIRDRFYGLILGAMRKRREAETPPHGPMHKSRCHKAQAERVEESHRCAHHLRELLLQRPETEDRPAILEPLRSEVIFDRLVAFGEESGVRVRFRNLEFGIEGEYIPATHVILLSSAMLSKDAYAVQVLVHELSHSLLHNPRCLMDISEGHVREEEEADLVTIAVLTDLGLPVEYYDGTVDEPGTYEINWDRLEASVDAAMYRRIRWATEVLVQAARGETQEAVSRSQQCPAA